MDPLAWRRGDSWDFLIVHPQRADGAIGRERQWATIRSSGVGLHRKHGSRLRWVISDDISRSSNLVDVPNMRFFLFFQRICGWSCTGLFLLGILWLPFVRFFRLSMTRSTFRLGVGVISFLGTACCVLALIPLVLFKLVSHVS